MFTLFRTLARLQNNTNTRYRQDTSALFVQDSKPLEFFIPTTEDGRINLINLITSHGGKVVEEASQGYYLSKFGDAHRDVIDPKFVLDSVEKKRIQSLNSYKVATYDDSSNSDAVAAAAAAAAAAKAATEVSEQNDASKATTDDAGVVQHLVTFIQSNDGSGRANDDQQQGDELDKLREERMNAASAVKEGNFVSKADRINLHNKNGFTRQEDDMILEEVRKNPHRRSTHKLFHEIAEKIGRHTGNSIRYRFRTHLQNELKYVYKTDDEGNLITDSVGKYIPTEAMPSTMKNKFTARDDYTLAKAVMDNIADRPESTPDDARDLVLPGKFFEQMAKDHPNHTRAAWRDRYRKFVVPYGVDKYLSYYEDELSANRVPEEIKNFTGRHLYKSAKKNKANDAELDTVVGESLLRHNNQLQQSQGKRRRLNGSSESDASNLFLHGDQAEIAGMLESQAAAAVAAASASNIHPNIENQLTDDLVTQKFFEFHPLNTVVDKIREIVGRNFASEEAEELINALYSEAGIQKKFGMFIIASVCGDLTLIPDYIEQFLKTAQNPPVDIHGIWTKRDDELLKKADEGDKEALEFVIKLHGDKRCDLRRTFMTDHVG